MKIGQAAKKFAVPVTSIYYYIKHGLLVPPVSRGQYVFDEKTLSDLEWLLTLKQMEFPLEVIHRVLSLRRISGLMPQEDRDELRKMFAKQDRALEEKIETLTHAQQLLRSSLSLLGAGDCEIVDTGVPLKMLRLLACPVCGGELRAQNASMDSRYIFEAEMNCRCGYSARIQNGILLTQNRNTSFYDKPDTIRELYRDLPSATLSLFERSYHWLGECLTKAGTTIPDRKRIFTIEDGSRELQLIREQNGRVVNSVVHTQTRDSENERQRIDQIALLDIALRFNPDIIAVGEMRGPEANAAQEAARVGVAVLTTIHSSSSEGTYRRMVSLCKRAVDTPDDTLMGYVTEAYPIVVYCRQLENKERRITNISECEILPDGSRRLHKLYEYNITENRLEGDRFIIEGHHQKCEEMSESLQRRFIENGMPRGELEQFIQRKEETA